MRRKEKRMSNRRYTGRKVRKKGRKAVKAVKKTAAVTLITGREAIDSSINVARDENDISGDMVRKTEEAAATGANIHKKIQKTRIKKEYSKAKRSAETARTAASYAQKAVKKTEEAARAVIVFVKDHLPAIGIIAGIGMLIMMMSTALSSCTTMITASLGEIAGCTYQSEPRELDAADLSFTKKEIELQKKINNVEADNPGYDEYNYVLDEIQHDPFVIENYLSAKYGVFTIAQVENDIQNLFNKVYRFVTTPRTETRTRTVTHTGVDENGIEYSYEAEEEYEVHILDVCLTRNEPEPIVMQSLSADEATMYQTLDSTKGALQRLYTPLDLDWYNQITSYYGYRMNPATGEEQFHRGIDIAVPEGTEVYASISGVVRETGYDPGEYGNYIVIANSQGYEARYAHLTDIYVSEGRSLTHGDLIAKTGSTGSATGSHLHIECLYKGEYFNPLFYFEDGNGSIYGTTDPIGGNGDVAGLIHEAEKYLGYPYVWGGSSPSTSFDCSGFVCWVVSHSGYADLPRTTAQGIYNQCTKIQPGEARPGDLIFFTGTYNSGNPVTHVGIYAGNGQMIHCGNPIKYTSVNTTYWQSHFYAYGRL